MANGQLKRMDRWVRSGSAITVLDYKSGWNERSLPDYERQMREYMSLMRSIYPKPYTVRGFLLRVDGVAHEVSFE